MYDLPNFYIENGALGDQAFFLCHIYSLCNYFKVPSVDIFSERYFCYIHPDEPPQYKKPNQAVLFLWTQCRRINSIRFLWSQEPNFFQYCPKDRLSTFHRISEWLDPLERITPLEGEKKCVFQPVSIQMKSKKLLGEYLCPWNHCIDALLNNGYSIYMIGSKEDEQYLPDLIDKKYMPKINNLINKISLTDALEMVLYQADFVLSCDSWAGVWGIANRVPTACAWGPRMEAGQDDYVLDYLGNRDVYSFDWSSKKEVTDRALAKWIKFKS